MRPDELYTDVEMMRDGSYRWLWSIRLPNALYRAGICMSQTDAQVCADRELKSLRQAQAETQAEKTAPLCPDGMIDFDALERGGPGPAPE